MYTANTIVILGREDTNIKIYNNKKTDPIVLLRQVLFHLRPVQKASIHG